MKVTEIFLSIDGEGKRTGLPTVFLRRYNCNLRCSYCDSLYSVNSGEYRDIPVEDIVKEVLNTSEGCKSLTLTGGEPLLYTSDEEFDDLNFLIESLLDSDFDINVETNGAVDLKPFLDYRNQGNGLWFTMDYKSISSGMSSRMLNSNLSLLNKNDVLKFVVGNKEDLDQMKSVLETYDPQAQVYVSPVFGSIEPKEIVEYVLSHNMYDVKVQIQLHKIIWDKDKRGV